MMFTKLFVMSIDSLPRVCAIQQKYRAHHGSDCQTV